VGAPHLPFTRIPDEPNLAGIPTYVIGGGTSLVGFDFAKLPAGYRIGANKSAWYANCDCITSIDQTFVRRYRDEIQAFVNTGKLAVLGLPPNEDQHAVIEGAVYVLRTRGEGLSPRKRELFGVHTGYAALNLAYHMGATEVALLGMDMQYASAEKTHWHEGYEWQSNESHRMYDRWARNFERIARELREAGVSVTNFTGSPGSKLTEFPTRPLADLL